MQHSGLSLPNWIHRVTSGNLTEPQFSLFLCKGGSQSLTDMMGKVSLHRRKAKP